MNYLFKLGIFSASITLLVILWNALMPISYATQNAYFAVPYFFLFSLLTFRYLENGIKHENKNTFTYRFMAVSGIRLFLSMIIVIIYALFNKDGLSGFALLFLFIYLMYTIFDVVLLMKRLKHD